MVSDQQKGRLSVETRCIEELRNLVTKSRIEHKTLELVLFGVQENKLEGMIRICSMRICLIDLRKQEVKGKQMSVDLW